MDLDQAEDSFFEEALKRYKAGSSADELLADFRKIIKDFRKVKRNFGNI